MVQSTNPRVASTVVIEKSQLEQILRNLSSSGFTVVGPKVDRSAVVIGEIVHANELPIGVSSRQAPGTYRLSSAGRTEHFSALPASPSWRELLFPPKQSLLRGRKTESGWVFEPSDDPRPRYAFIGIRSCELAAINIYDKIFLSDGIHEESYARRRQSLFVLAVNCTNCSANCFCTSMKTGPRVAAGFDLALTELADVFVLESGSEIGSEMLGDVDWRPASAFDLGRVSEVLQLTEQQMSRKLQTEDLAEQLMASLDSPIWDELGAKCLSCGNCTFVCPTCFCTTVEDTSDISYTATARERCWDSCYSSEFSHVAGGNIRPTTSARHRQWVTHKLASSLEQLGRFACVGCGRCTTWCPVGIDIVKEVCEIRSHARR